MRLVAYLVHADSGAPYEECVPAVSEPFTIISQRPRLPKADVPCMSDSIGALAGIGATAVQRLRDLNAAADGVGVALRLPPAVNSVRTVADFLRLLDHIGTNIELDDSVRNTLARSRPVWADVKRAARGAVERDDR